MKKVYKKSITGKLYMILGLCWIWMSMSSCLFSYYAPSSDISFSGTTSYCVGATATPNTLTYDQCSLGGGIFSSGVTMNVQWYYNNTGGTVIGTSTPLGAPYTSFSASGGPGTESYTPLTGTIGTFYYFAYMTWTTTGTCSSSYTSGTQMVSVGSPPTTSITGTPTSICIGATTGYSIGATGGIWVSGSPGVASVSASGIVTGLSAGTSLISYAISGCPATRAVTVLPTPSAITPAAPVTFCQGTTYTLSDAVAGGTWSSSNIAAATVSTSGVVTGVGGGTSTITYKLSSGCFVTKTVSVSPIPGPIGGPGMACLGYPVTLTNASPGGTWTSADPTIATINPTTGVLTAVSLGTVVISYTGCGTATTIITINMLPGPIVGPDIACPGYPTALTNSAGGGTWVSSDPLVATVNATTGVVTGVAVGTSVISYSTCTTVTKIITVNPLPALIVGPGYVCEGGPTIALSDATPGGTWSSSTPSSATAVTTPSGVGAVTGVSPGTAVITYMSPLSCFSTTVVTVNSLPAPIGGNTPLCTGSTIVLTNTAGIGTWTSSVPGVATVDGFTGVVTGIVGGTTTVSYTNACGTASAIVTVSAQPAPITGRDSTCVGSHTTLADITIGGTWSSSNVAVATVVSGAGSGLVTGIAVGTTYISYIMPGGCFVTDLLTTFMFPSAISGSTALCPGTTTTLSDAVAGGTWSSSNPVAATVGSLSGVVTGLSADTAGITYTTTYGCEAYLVVTVNPLPLPITGTNTLCATDIDTLADLSLGGTWSSLTPAVVTIDPATGVATTLAGGTATIRYTLPTGCSVTRSFTVNPIPAPVVTFNTVINTFYTTVGYSSYQWYDSIQGLIPGATTYRTAGLWNGYYYVVVTDENGCKGVSAHYPYNVTMEVANTNGKANMKIFPNPATEIVYIDCPVPVRATITTADGKKVMEQSNAKKMDISKLANGIYYVTVYDLSGTELKVQKVVKE